MKLIVDNRTRKPIAEALKYVAYVVGLGRISDDGKAYCYATVFHGGVKVYAKRNAKSDTFVVTK